MMTPDTETTAYPNASVVAMSALFDKIGPSVFFTHSASGFTGWQTAIVNENVKAIVAIELGGFLVTECIDNYLKFSITNKSDPFKNNEFTRKSNLAWYD
jgi:hypothetical protein